MIMNTSAASVFANLESQAFDRACVKTSLENHIGKIDLTESRIRDDRRPAKGLRYPIFGVARKFLEFSHGLGRPRLSLRFSLTVESDLPILARA